MSDLRFVCVSGFFASGSSAVVDLLKEMKDFYECSAEVRIIKDPYGITQMENALVDNWELINSSVAISDFLWLSRICARNRYTPFSPAGLGYSKTISGNFMELINEYTDSLSEYKYKAEFYHQKFKKPYLKFIIDRFRFGIEHITKGKLKTANRNIPYCYFAHPTQERFNDATKKLFEQLFQQQKKEGFTDIILDQAISPNNPSVIHRYFNNAKMIIVDRDPRDMYVDDMMCGVMYDKDYTSAEAGKRYADRQKQLRVSIPANDADVLYIRFEDLIINYDKTVDTILQFLNLSTADHVDQYKYLKPEISRKNIGIWKTKYDECKGAIDAIRVSMPKHCINY